VSQELKILLLGGCLMPLHLKLLPLKLQLLPLELVLMSLDLSKCNCCVLSLSLHLNLLPLQAWVSLSRIATMAGSEREADPKPPALWL
jgi:hypothetical protein